MSEAEAPPALAPGNAAPDDTAGSMLRRAREAAGLHVANLAVNLKVPVRKLEALEADRYDLLPDAVFVRALASSVCRTLKIDPQPVLERLPQSTKPRLIQDDDGINAPFRAPGDGPTPGLLDHLSRPVVLGVLALLMAAVVLVFLPESVDKPETAAPAAETPPVTLAAAPPAPAPARVPVAPSAPAPAPAQPSPPPVSLQAPVNQPAPLSEAAPAAAAKVAKVASAPAPLVAPAPVAAAAAARGASAVVPPASPVAAPRSAASAAQPAVAGAAPARAAASSAAFPAGLVAFRTSGISWIQVNDARGQEVLRRLMGPGDTATATGVTPLTVTVGSVASTEVQVRGKPFNLGAVNRDNVARFEVR